MLEQIGSGGMGQVYAAYDPNLDRKIALKVLHEERDGCDDPRLVREAQALARLSHPNVVAVHDVGMHDGRLFVAMEFVEGITLREWLQRHPPPGSAERLGEVLELLLQAGEGLAAAHRAGLVHRDFKPGNVLIGKDGRVRVVDFGVVRVEDSLRGNGRRHLELVRDEEPSPPPEGPLVDLVSDAPLTRPGALVGTPAYMAPEQLLSLQAEAACDQFGFCVTAWEVIFGARPFGGKTIPAVLESIRKGQVTRSFEVECPRELERALRKGLSFAPRGRHRSMDALLEVLRQSLAQLRGETMPPPPPSKRWLWLGAVALTGTTAITAFALAQDSQLCTGAEAHLSGAWDDAVKAELEQAFLRTEAGFAPEVWDRVERELDGYAEAWIAGHRDACEAAQVRGEQSTELMDLRMACLDARRRDLAALTEVYAMADVDMIARADEAIAALDRVDACADVEHVRHRGTLPEDAGQAARVDAVLAMVARSSALSAAGRYADALELATTAAADADELGLPATAARAHLQLGNVHTLMRQRDAAREELETAYMLTRGTEAHDVAFEASRTLIHVSGALQLRFPEGRWWARVAQFESEWIDDERQLAKLQLNLGAFAGVEGRFLEAARRFEDAVALLRRDAGPGHLAYADALATLGDLRILQGGPDEALPLLEEATAVAQRRLGARHPWMARFHTSRARAHRLRGDLERASEEIERAVVLSEEAFGRDHVALCNVLEELANVLEDRGDIDQAIATVERARGLVVPEPPNETKQAQLLARVGEIRFQQHDFPQAEVAFRQALQLSRAELGDFHPHTARTRIALGAALGALGRREEGLPLIEAGLVVGEAVLGSEHPDVASTYDILAAEMERSGDLDRALEYTERTLRINEAAFGTDSFQLMKPHGNMCAVLGQLGQVEKAVEHCERALELATVAVSFDEALLAKLHNNLGAALVADGRHEEALRHYEQARGTWVRQLGARAVMVGIVLANIAEVHEAQGRLEEARREYEESLAIREERLGPGHPMVVVPLVGLANVSTARGRTRDAEAFARRAMAVAEETGATELVLARAQEAVAHALWEQPGGANEAARLVAMARGVFEQAGQQAAADRARLDGWCCSTARREDR